MGNDNLQGAVLELSQAIIGASYSVELILDEDSPLRDFFLSDFLAITDKRLENKLILSGTPEFFDDKFNHLEDTFEIRKVKHQVGSDMFLIDREFAYCVNDNIPELKKYVIPIYKVNHDYILKNQIEYFDYLWKFSNDFILYDNLSSIVSIEQEKRIIVATDDFYKNLIIELERKPQDLYKLEPRKFEELIAHLLNEFGYKTHITPATRDGGKDIIAQYRTPDGTSLLCLVECKRYSKDRPVGVDCIRSLYGAVMDDRANLGMIVTTSSFTGDAKKFQEKNRNLISLKDYYNLIEWIKTCT